MTGYLGKKIDLTCSDGKKFSGYVFDIIDAEDSEIAKDCIAIDPLDKLVAIEIPVDDIIGVIIDDRYQTIDFYH